MVYTGSGPAEPGQPINGEPGDEVSESLYFFPDQTVSSRDERAWVISHLLRFALWDDIWGYVTREEVREMFPHLELPDNLRNAWGRMLKIEAAPVG